MARAKTKNTTEEVTVTETIEATETKVATPEPTEEDVKAFEAAALEAIAQRDEATGELPTIAFEKPLEEYRNLANVKTKNLAKVALDDIMTEAMSKNDMSTARAALEISHKLTSAPTRVKREKPQADPTEAYVELVAGIVLAGTLAQAEVPEGVAEDWPTRVEAEVAEAYPLVSAYNEHIVSESEEEPPATPAWIVAAIKLAAGRSARVGSKTRAAGGKSTYIGVRRDVARHITSAFADVPSGTFLKISEIANHASEEYGDDRPSPGAISARLFPKSGKPTSIEGITSDTRDGSKGAVKN